MCQCGSEPNRAADGATDQQYLLEAESQQTALAIDEREQAEKHDRNRSQSFHGVLLDGKVLLCNRYPILLNFFQYNRRPVYTGH